MRSAVALPLLVTDFETKNIDKSGSDSLYFDYQSKGVASCKIL